MASSGLARREHLLAKMGTWTRVGGGMKLVNLPKFVFAGSLSGTPTPTTGTKLKAPWKILGQKQAELTLPGGARAKQELMACT